MTTMISTPGNIRRKNINFNLSHTQNESTTQDELEEKAFNKAKTSRVEDTHNRQTGNYTIKNPNQKNNVLSNKCPQSVRNINLNQENTLQKTGQSKFNKFDNDLEGGNYLSTKCKLVDPLPDKVLYSSLYKKAESKKLIPIIKTSEKNLQEVNPLFANHHTESEPNLPFVVDANNQHVKLALERFNIDEFTIFQDIYDSIYGKVYKVHNLQSNEYSMLRVFTPNPRYIDMFFTQFEMSSKYKNEFLHEIIGACIGKPDKLSYSLNLLMEGIDSDLESHAISLKTQKDHYKEDEILMIMKSAVNALCYLKENNACHGQISPKSIVFITNSNDQTLNVKLSLPEIIDPLTNQLYLLNNEKLLRETLKMNELYLSPILFSSFTRGKFTNTKHDIFKSDIYSLGLTIIYAATLSTKILFLIRAKTDSESIKKLLIEYMRGKYSSQLIDLLCGMITVDEKKRLSYNIILEKIEEIEKIIS